MNIQNLSEHGKLNKEAPKKGVLLIYTRAKVLFQKYESLEEVMSLCEGEEVLEMHLFDRTKEYRMVSSRSPRARYGFFEHVAAFEDQPNSVYKVETKVEAPYVENVSGKLVVLNHLSIDEKGMISIDDYRLLTEGGK